MLNADSTAPGAAMARLFLTVLLACAALPAQADEHTVVVQAPAPEKGCVEVEVHGQRAQSMSCLSEKLLPNSNTMNRQPPPVRRGGGRTTRPSNQLGLYNRAALEHRMGNAFGKSVTPQRRARRRPPARCCRRADLVVNAQSICAVKIAQSRQLRIIPGLIALETTMLPTIRTTPCP